LIHRVYYAAKNHQSGQNMLLNPALPLSSVYVCQCNHFSTTPKNRLLGLVK